MTHEFEQMLQLAALGATGHPVCVAGEGVDWTKLIDIARRQKAEYYLFYALKQNKDLLCPDEVRKSAQKEIRALMVSNALHKSAIVQLLNDMEAAGIHAVLLKGYALSDCYVRPECRICGDVDLLIAPEDEEQACEFMRQHGFAVEPRWKNGHHAVCYHEMLGCVELHVMLYDEIVEDVWHVGLGVEHFVEEAHVKLETEDGSYYTLGFTDHFLFVVLHMIKHFLESGLSLQMIFDVGLFFKKHANEIDSIRFWKTVKALKYEKLVNCVLWVLIQYCGFKTEDFPGVSEEKPEELEDLLLDMEAGGWMGCENKNARIEGWNAYNRQLLMNGKSEFQYLLYMIRWKIGLYWNAAFPSFDKLAEKYPVVRKHKLLLPAVWVYRLFAAGSRAVKKGALTSYIVFDEEQISDPAKGRVELFRKMDMMK